MTLESDLFDTLSNDAGVIALVSNRIYPLLAPQDSPVPLVTYQKIFADWNYGLEAIGVLQNATIQIDCWSASYSGSKTLFLAVKSAMDTATAFKAILLNDLDLQDPDTRDFRVTADFSVWHKIG